MWGLYFLKEQEKKKENKRTQTKRKEKKMKRKEKQRKRKESTIKYTNWKNGNMLNQYFRLAWRSVPFSTPSPLGSRGSPT